MVSCEDWRRYKASLHYIVSYTKVPSTAWNNGTLAHGSTQGLPPVNAGKVDRWHLQCHC